MCDSASGVRVSNDSNGGKYRHDWDSDFLWSTKSGSSESDSHAFVDSAFGHDAIAWRTQVARSLSGLSVDGEQLNICVTSVHGEA